jgi:hypothetical protein
MVHTVAMQHGLRETVATRWGWGRECHAVDATVISAPGHATAACPAASRGLRIASNAGYGVSAETLASCHPRVMRKQKRKLLSAR